MGFWDLGRAVFEGGGITPTFLTHSLDILFLDSVPEAAIKIELTMTYALDDSWLACSHASQPGLPVCTTLTRKITNLALHTRSIEIRDSRTIPISVIICWFARHCSHGWPEKKVAAGLCNNGKFTISLFLSSHFSLFIWINWMRSFRWVTVLRIPTFFPSRTNSHVRNKTRTRGILIAMDQLTSCNSYCIFLAHNHMFVHGWLIHSLCFVTDSYSVGACYGSVFVCVCWGEGGG